MRHGEAELMARSDAERNLTDRGLREVRAQAQRLSGQSALQLLVSPYLRAQQTMQLVREVAGLGQTPQTVDWLVPETHPQQVLEQLQAYDADLLLVAHQPLLGRLAGVLCQGSAAAGRPFATAEVRLLTGDACWTGLMTEQPA